MKKAFFALVSLALLTVPFISAAEADGVNNTALINSSITISGKSVTLGGTYAPARATANGNSPGTGTSAGPVMAGLALTITPATSGNIFVSAPVTASNSSAAVGCSTQVAFGTGGAPAHNAAQTGTQSGSLATATSAAAGSFVTLPLTTYITGLTPGTTYWVDLQYLINGGGTCTINSYNIQAIEQ